MKKKMQKKTRAGSTKHFEQPYKVALSDNFGTSPTVGKMQCKK